MSRGAASACLLLVLLASAGAQEAFPAGPFAAFRTENRLQLPIRDPVLDRLCAARAAELAASGELSHADRLGRGPGLQSAASGYPAGEFGEVLGAGARPPELWRGWLASPAHREVLAAPGWVRWGAGSAPRGGTTVWVLRFWRP